MPGLPFEQTPVNEEDFFSSTLNNAFALRKQELEQDFNNQSAMLELPVDKRISQLKDKYRLREYQLRRAKLTDEDFGKQMNSLIEKYEQEELGIKQKADLSLEVARQQLQDERVNQLAKLEAEQHKTIGKVQAINYLVETGRLPQEEGQQELYKMLGIEYKPKTSQEKFNQLDSYIKDLETELSSYIPAKEGGWFSKGESMKFDPSGGYGIGVRDATEEEQIQYHTILQELRAARKNRNSLQREIQGGHLRIGMLQKAYTERANKSFTRNKEHMYKFDINKNAFVDKFVETGKNPTTMGAGISQQKPEKKKLDKTTAQQFLQQANGNKEKARQLARQAGYEF